MRSHYLTIVYNTDKMTQDEVDSVVKNEQVSAMAWGHLLDEVKELRARVELLKEMSASKIPDGCMWAVTKGGRTICQPPKEKSDA